MNSKLVKKSYKEVKGNAKDIFKKQESFEYEELVKTLKDIDSKEVFELEHPETQERCTAISNVRVRMANVISFCTADKSDYFLVIQISHFINAIYCNGVLYTYNSFGGLCNLVIKDVLVSSAIINELKMIKKYGGYILDQTRPFHFFYDQLINVVSCDGKLNLAVPEESYINPNSLGYKKNQVKSELFYIFPCTIGMRSQFKDNMSIHRPEAKKMEKLLQRSFPSKKEEKDKLSIWYGITSDKRSLVEQIEVIIFIIENIHDKFKKISLTIDGMTSKVNENNSYEGDLRIFNKIKNKLRGFKNVEVESVIGFTYEFKIPVCNQCDFFLANGGFGSFLPLRVCDKPGIIHNNNLFFNFPDFYNENIYFIEEKYVRDLSDNKRADFTSYSIHWAVLANYVFDLINSIFNMKIKKIKLEKEHELNSEFCQNRIKSIKEIGVSADAFRDLAIMARGEKEFSLAKEYIYNAYLIRPTGERIKKIYMELEGG